MDINNIEAKTTIPIAKTHLLSTTKTLNTKIDYKTKQHQDKYKTQNSFAKQITNELKKKLALYSLKTTKNIPKQSSNNIQAQSINKTNNNKVNSLPILSPSAASISTAPTFGDIPRVTSSFRPIYLNNDNHKQQTNTPNINLKNKTTFNTKFVQEKELASDSLLLPVTSSNSSRSLSSNSSVSLTKLVSGCLDNNNFYYKPQTKKASSHHFDLHPSKVAMRRHTSVANIPQHQQQQHPHSNPNSQSTKRWPSFNYSNPQPQPPRRPASVAAAATATVGGGFSRTGSRRSPSLGSLLHQPGQVLPQLQQQHPSSYEMYDNASYDFVPQPMYYNTRQVSIEPKTTAATYPMPSNDYYVQPQEQQQQYDPYNAHYLFQGQPPYAPPIADGRSSRNNPAAHQYSPMSPMSAAAPAYPSPYYVAGSTARPLYVARSKGSLVGAGGYKVAGGSGKVAAMHVQLPQHKPVHLHPQWAFSRPFAHLRSPSQDDNEFNEDTDDDIDASADDEDDDDDDEDDDNQDDANDDESNSEDIDINDDQRYISKKKRQKQRQRQKRKQNKQRMPRVNFVPFNRFEDTNVLRACDWHPSGEVYVIGSNSKTLRICTYPAEGELRNFSTAWLQNSLGDNTASSGLVHGQHNEQVNMLGGSVSKVTSSAKASKDKLIASRGDVVGVGDKNIGNNSRAASTIHQPPQPRILFKFLQVHKGSIYCTVFNASGHLIATGSNDQSVRFWRYNSLMHSPDGEGYRLTMHNSTVRDLCFIDDLSSKSALLLSAGGGDNKVYVTDCDTATPFQSFAGHTSMVMSLSSWGGSSFVSASFDKTIRFWDLRSRSCTSIVSAPPTLPGDSNLSPLAPRASGNASHTNRQQLYTTKWNGAGPGPAVTSVKVEPSGRLLVSGHADATCMLYDVRAARIIQTFKQHTDEVRTLSFSPRAYYLLTGGYDGKIMLNDLQGDISQSLPTVCVSTGNDKVIQAKWHPNHFTFISCCANKSATLWAIPQD